jgi:preprotein translocase subunit SecE
LFVDGFRRCVDGGSYSLFLLGATMKVFEKKFGDWFNFSVEEADDVNVWTTIKDAVKMLLMVPVVFLCMVCLIAINLLSFIVPITLGAVVVYFTWTALSDRTEPDEPPAKTQVVQQEKTP